jgi:predicted Zn-dependent peptidase
MKKKSIPSKKQQKKTQKKQTTTKSIHYLSKLDNGLKCYIKNIKSAINVNIVFMVKTGSIQDGKYQGLSHLLEHMFYVGTQKNNSEIELVRKLESEGSIINGSTDNEHTSYYITLSPNKLFTHIKLLAEMIKFSTIDGYNLEEEKNVVYNEINMRKDKLSTYYNRLASYNIYKNSIYKDPVAGTQSTLKPVEKHHLLAYMKSQYLPQNCIFGIRGKINYKLDDLLNLVKKEFGGKDLFSHYEIKNTHIKYKDYMNEYKYFQSINKNINNDIMRKKVKYNWGFNQIVDKKALQAYVYIYFEGIPVVKNNKISKENKIIKQIKTYLNFGLSGKLKEDIRCNNKLIYNMSIKTPNHSYQGLFNIQYNIKPDKNEDVVKSLEIVMDNLNKLKTQLLDEKTVFNLYKQKRFRDAMTEDDILDNTFNKCEEYVFANINSQYYKDEIKKSSSPKTKKNRSKDITPKDIIKYSQQIFNSSKMGVFIVSPKKINLDFDKIKKLL